MNPVPVVPHVVEHLTGVYLSLLLLACLIAMIVKRLRIPYSIALVVVGLIVALLKLAPGIVLAKDITFTLILPPLLFAAALEMDLESLRDHWMPIALLAIPGVVISTAVIGYVVHWSWQVPLLVGLLFGALITPTDPISVLAICREVRAPKHLRVIMEGESLFNDGTGVVVFSLLLGLVLGQEGWSVSGVVWEFLKVAIGGTIVGGVLGYITYWVLALTKDHLVEITLTVVLAFGASLLAEYMHVSGVIAAVVAGLVVGNYARVLSLSPKARATLADFWETVAFIINSILFLLIGLELQEISLAYMQTMWPAIGGAVLAVHFARAVTIYPVTWLARHVRPDLIRPSYAHVFYWGGLKGSIPLALVVGLPQSFMHREAFLVVAFVLVFFSLIVQGLTMKPLLRTLGLGQTAS